MPAKRMLESLTPPVLWQSLARLKRAVLPSSSGYAYAPEGWATRLPGGAHTQDYWRSFIDRHRPDSAELVARFHAGDRTLALDSGEGLKHLVFGYVLSLVAHQKRKVSVLDYGSSFGDYYWVARSLVPGVELDYHCKELPAVAEAGRALTPEATWYTDDGCLDQPHDLTMFSSSVQYVTDWQGVLRRAVHSTGSHLFLSDVPTVRNVPTYVATERLEGRTNLHHQLNSGEVVRTIEDAGLILVREFAMGGHPPIANAPEQPRSVGWLFARPAQR